MPGEKYRKSQRKEDWVVTVSLAAPYLVLGFCHQCVRSVSYGRLTTVKLSSPLSGEWQLAHTCELCLWFRAWQLCYTCKRLRDTPLICFGAEEGDCGADEGRISYLPPPSHLFLLMPPSRVCGRAALLSFPWRTDWGNSVRGYAKLHLTYFLLENTEASTLLIACLTQKGKITVFQVLNLYVYSVSGSKF